MSIQPWISTGLARWRRASHHPPFEFHHPYIFEHQP
jgi:hypothetical protein